MPARTLGVRVAMLAVALAAALGACGPRQVDVRSDPAPATDAALSISMTNNLAQPVNVYVVSQGTDLFVKQVPPNTTELLPVRGLTTTGPVRLRATTVDGTRTFTRDDVVLTSNYQWRVP
jgi:hypothetical protein